MSSVLNSTRPRSSRSTLPVTRSPLASVITSVRGCAPSGAAPTSVIRIAAAAILQLPSGRGERVAAERIRDLGDRALRADTVAGVVERRRDHRDAELAW